MTSSIVLTLHGVKEDYSCASSDQDPGAEKYTITTSALKSMTDVMVGRKSCTIDSFSTKQSDTWLILTFDDGLISDYEKAFPVLREKQIKATFFVTVENIGKPGYMDIVQIREMASYGMEIGSHGLQHQYLVSLSSLQARQEIEVSKDKLEQALGAAVFSFAPVGGHFKSWMLDFAEESGYSAFASMNPGGTVLDTSKKLIVFRRNHIQSHHQDPYVCSLLNGDRKTIVKNVIRYQLLGLPKRLLGMKTYDHLKHILMRTGS